MAVPVLEPSCLNVPVEPVNHVDRVLHAKDYYIVLGLRRRDISQTTPPAVFTAAYKRMALLVHPYKTREEGAAAAFSRLKQAMTVLTDPRLRTAYNQQLRQPSQTDAERAMEQHQQRQRSFEEKVAQMVEASSRARREPSGKAKAEMEARQRRDAEVRAKLEAEERVRSEQAEERRRKAEAARQRRDAAEEATKLKRIAEGTAGRLARSASAGGGELRGAQTDRTDRTERRAAAMAFLGAAMGWDENDVRPATTRETVTNHSGGISSRPRPSTGGHSSRASSPRPSTGGHSSRASSPRPQGMARAATALPRPALATAGAARAASPRPIGRSIV